MTGRCDSLRCQPSNEGDKRPILLFIHSRPSSMACQSQFRSVFLILAGLAYPRIGKSRRHGGSCATDALHRQGAAMQFRQRARNRKAEPDAYARAFAARSLPLRSAAQYPPKTNVFVAGILSWQCKRHQAIASARGAQRCSAGCRDNDEFPSRLCLIDGGRRGGGMIELCAPEQFSCVAIESAEP